MHVPKLIWSIILISGCQFINAASTNTEVNIIVNHSARSFTIETPRLSATFEDAVIVEMKNLKSGEVHASADLMDLNIPVGMGHLRDNLKGLEKLHVSWGTQPVGKPSRRQTWETGEKYSVMHRPHSGSEFSVKEIENGISATWTGLTNGETKFSQDTFTIDAWVDDKTGTLLFKSQATSTERGAFGVQVPLANLHSDHRFYIPSFGGEMHDKNLPPALITRGGSPFLEAPVIGVEGRKGSFGLWVENRYMHPNFLFLNWSGNSFSLALEHLNLMPFESHKSVDSVAWHLDVFDGGWVDAMTPYKDWYAKTFAEEMQIRASVKWADRIRVIVDTWPSEEAAHEVADLIDPSTVMFHQWNARSPRFDTELPDWTPRKGYVEQVKLLQKLGFRTMAYVNTYCVNYNSSVFKRDQIAEFGLTRRIKDYARYTRPRQSFETAKEGQILYLDPLSARWRRYHTDQMLEWREKTGTDANYEDVAGTAGDFGNGVIGGLFGAQGGVAQFQELLQRNPAVPMASEYAPDNIAFAVRWPLRYQQVWGSDTARHFWMSSMRPVSAYLFGPLHRAWVPVIRAQTGFLKHMVVACSDALGGLAQLSADSAELKAERGISAHMRQRAQLFSRRQLEPYFQRERYEENLACMYRDQDGGLYRYYTDGDTQQMIGPDGRLLYQRVTGRQHLRSPLMLPGWPAIGKDGEHFGLDPRKRYVLTAGTNDIPKIRVTALPEGVAIRKFYTTERYTVLVLEPVSGKSPKEGRVGVVSSVPLKYVLVNDFPALPQAVGPGQTAYQTTFPAYFLFIEGNVDEVAVSDYLGNGKESGRYLLLETGLERGGIYISPHNALWRPQSGANKEMFTFINGGGDAEIVVDYLARVPAVTTSLRVYLKNRQNRHGNGTIARLYINGRQVRARDFASRPGSNWQKGKCDSARTVYSGSFYMWQVPLGAMAGQPVLVSVSTDSKADTNADSLWWSRPRFIEDAAQQRLFAEIAGNDLGPKCMGKQISLP